MRTFACSVCHSLVFFENSACLHCGAALGFAWDRRELLTLRDAGDGRLLPATGDGAARHRCANAALAACNSLVGAAGALCEACALTRTRPADEDASGLGGFRLAEVAKRRLLFEL